MNILVDYAHFVRMDVDNMGRWKKCTLRRYDTEKWGT